MHDACDSPPWFDQFPHLPAALLCAAAVTPPPASRNKHTSNQAGDVLILTKPLGVGVMTTALKKGLLPPEGYDEVR